MLELAYCHINRRSWCHVVILSIQCDKNTLVGLFRHLNGSKFEREDWSLEDAHGQQALISSLTDGSFLLYPEDLCLGLVTSLVVQSMVFTTSYIYSNVRVWRPGVDKTLIPVYNTRWINWILFSWNSVLILVQLLVVVFFNF